MKKSVSTKLQAGMIAGQSIDSAKKDISRKFRKNMTNAEKLLWRGLRANRLNGIKFRRQQVIGHLIADFYCHEFGLVIEVDGSVHDKKYDYDKSREDFFNERGLDVLRFKNESVILNLDGVLSEILSNCNILGLKKTSPPTPPLKREGSKK